MSNPNNCATCSHKQNPAGAWCYMFLDEPTAVCAQHTARAIGAPSRIFMAPERCSFPSCQFSGCPTGGCYGGATR